jgi:diguanylate cyclase (GGDEF)-like protein
MKNVHKRTLQGFALALGAPLGWAAIRILQGAELRVELTSQASLYAYMWVGSSLAFALFGQLIGRHEDALQEGTITDSLTGLRNRRYFMTRLEEELHAAARHGRPLSLLIIDVDHLKEVNDQKGHPAGDRLLASLSSLFSQQMRQGETAARLGGDEFAVLMPSTGLAEACGAAQRLCKAVQDKAEASVSIGVGAVEAGSTIGALDLYGRADKALYRAKRAGRGRMEADAGP